MIDPLAEFYSVMEVMKVAVGIDIGFLQFDSSRAAARF